ncbi:MAG: M48 family metallopeptidase [Bryobacteraceae bacterium]|nr:M48 family metallopeptidase [Bryobacteraceae bacterium]
MYGQGGRRGRVMWLPLLLFGLYAAYYYFSNRQKVPLTGRTQLVDMSREQEAALGFQSYRQILASERIVRSGQAADLVKSIGARISKVSEDPGFEWEYNLIESDQANAFCLPGGKVAVYTGILPITKNVDGLAVVMGHEIAHAIARHGAERMAQEKLVRIGQMATGVAVGDMDPQTQHMIMGAFGLGAKFGMLLPFSREHESEADYMGLIYVAKTCFDPREAPKLWERMGRPRAARRPSSPPPTPAIPRASASSNNGCRRR